MALVVDNFAGGGGASIGIEAALGRPVDIAINHDPEAMVMHAANHPETEHLCKNVWRVDPDDIRRRGRVALAWFSPDCKHFSKAKGARPVKRHIRDLAWVVVNWARRAKPDVIMLENVEEFQDWAPLALDGKPCPLQKGATFQKWVKALRALGYRVEWRELRACDYGTPTIRKRLFVIARRDGRPIVWPEPTHGDGLSPYRTAAECIDWTIPVHSIFLTAEEAKAVGVKRPLAEATMKRIARGVWRYVINAAEPFIVTCNHGGDWFRGQGLRAPFNTVTAARDAHGLVVPMTVGVGGRAGQSRPRSADEPTATSTTKADTSLVAAHLTRFNQNGLGQKVADPIDTVMAGAPRFGLVASFLAQHNGGMTGHDARKPLSTVTQRGTQQQLVMTHLMNMKGSDRASRGADQPAPTITAGGQHVAEVRAFLLKYYGTGIGQAANVPMHSVTTKDRFGVVTVSGVDYQIVDIGMRMLTPRELFRAQGFPDSYIIDPNYKGKPLTKTAQIRMCGNSVCPQLAEALVRANVHDLAETVAA